MSSVPPPEVLVVDDEPGIRELLTDALESFELSCRTAANGREAIRSARRRRPDLVVTDLMLGDCTGLDVIDHLRHCHGEIPSIVITGQGTPENLSEASRRRPIELITKPLKLERLREAVRAGLESREKDRRRRRRWARLRTVARDINRRKRSLERRLEGTCADLTNAYHTLNGQLLLQQSILDYQRELIAAGGDDDVFRALFRTVVHRSGPVFGVALVCDAEAQLRIVGRFGVPQPDALGFCEALVRPVVDDILVRPEPVLLDAQERTEDFPESIRRYLVGLSILAVPLLPAPGELIGLVVLYRKGEQPFTDEDLALADMVAAPTAAAVRKND